MKKTLSLLLSIVMLFSITAGLDFSSAAATSDVESIEYVPVKPIEIIENSNGYWNYNFDEDTEEITDLWFYYFDDPLLFVNPDDCLTVNYEDGSKEQFYLYGEATEEYVSYEWRSEAGNVISSDEVEFWTTQYESHWGIDTENYVYLEYAGAATEIPVKIIETPVSSISANFNVPLIENVSGYYSEDYNGESFFYYDTWNMPFELTINYKDGTSKTVTACNWYMIDDCFVFTDDIQYYDPWHAGADNTIYLSYMGVEAEANVKIVKNPVKDFTVTQTKTFVDPDNHDGSGICPDCVIESDCLQFVVTYNDGTTDTFTADELLGETHVGGDGGEEGDAFSSSLDYAGKYMLKVNYACNDQNVVDGTVMNFEIAGVKKDIALSVEVGEHEHAYTETVVEPTCTEDGYTLHTCYCGDSYRDNFVEKTGHTVVTDSAVDPTCTDNGKTEGSHCSVCGEVIVAQQDIPALGHTFGEWTYGTGERTRECSVCGKIDSEAFVTNLEVSDITGDSFEVSFDAVEGATNYWVQLYRNGAWSVVTTLDTNHGKVSGLDLDSEYLVRIRAYNVQNGNRVFITPWSDSESVKTLDAATVAADLAAPQNLVLSKSTTNGVRITFDKVPGADGYEIQYYHNGEWIHYVYTGWYDKEWTGWNPSGTFDIRVRAYKKVGSTVLFSDQWSEVKRFFTKPLQVTGVKTASRSADGTALTLTWDAQKWATGYRVYKRGYNNQWWLIATIYGPQNNSYTVTGLTPTYNYGYKVRAFKDGPGNLGAFSEEHSTDAALPQPALCTVMSNAAGRLYVSWNPVKCSGYEVMVSTTPNFSKNNRSYYYSGENNNKVIINIPGNNYYVRVRAYYKKGSSTTYSVWTGPRDITVK